MSAINVNSITGRTGSHGPVLTGLTTVTGDLHVGGGVSFSGIGTYTNGLNVTSGSVGIGTDNPAGTLEIDTASTTDMLLLDVSGTNFAKIGHNSASGTNILDVRSEGHTRFLTGGNNERLRILSTGDVGIGTASPDNRLHVLTSSTDVAMFESTSAGAGPAITFDHSGASPADDDNIGKIVFNGKNDANESLTYADIKAISTDVSDGTEDCALSFNTRAAGSFSEKIRISSGGNFLIGNQSDTAPDGFDSLIQVNADNHRGSITIGRHTANANGPALLFQKSRSGSATPGNGVVSDNDTLGIIRFYGSDGTDRNSFAANIACEVDGSPGGNDMPGRLIFSTTADGAASATQAMTIKANHNVEIHDGNIVFETSGDGIDFSANADASGRESELLNDYEHGTFTPTINVEGQANAAIDGVSGTYVKVGKMVYAAFHCVLNGTPGSRTTSTAIEFGGMPFTSLDAGSSGADEYIGSVRMHPVDNGSSLGDSSEFIFRLFDNSTGGRIEVRKSNGDLANAALYMVDNQQISASVTYRTAS